jgi:hypothetical protein
MKPTTLKDARIIDKTTVNSNDAYMVDLSGASGSSIDRIRFIVASPPQSPQPQSLPFGLTTNQYYHVVVTYNQNNVLFYINGVLNNTFPKTGLSTNNNNPLRFAANSLLDGNWFHGNLDDIAIWNRALSEQEVKNIYNGNICYQNVSVTDTLFINSMITSFNPVTYENTIKIYPNPTQGQLTIDFGNINTLSGYQMKIINPLGQQIFQSNISQRISNITLSSFATKGVYFVQLIDGKGTITENRKIVIQ